MTRFGLVVIVGTYNKPFLTRAAVGGGEGFIREVAPDTADPPVFVLPSLSERLSAHPVVAFVRHLGRHIDYLTVIAKLS